MEPEMRMLRRPLMRRERWSYETAALAAEARREAARKAASRVRPATRGGGAAAMVNGVRVAAAAHPTPPLLASPSPPRSKAP